jgi:protein-disulfide isomerase
MKNLNSARRTSVLFASLAAMAFAALPAVAETTSTPASTSAPAASTPAAATPAADNSAPQSVSNLTPEQQQAIGALIKNYIAAHPEIVQGALDELDKRQKEAEAEKARMTIRDNNATLLNSAHQVVLGNPKGDVTMVEFFDYNCGFCKRALPDMMSLLGANPNLRFVLKEFPVLGDGSVEAAHVAVAARMQDPTGKKYIEFHQKLLGGRGAADKARALAVAKEVGFDIPRIEKDMDSPEVKATIDEDMKLADLLGVSGTPTYVIGDEVVVGAVGLDELKKKLSPDKATDAATGKTPEKAADKK